MFCERMEKSGLLTTIKNILYSYLALVGCHLGETVPETLLPVYLMLDFIIND